MIGKTGSIILVLLFAICMIALASNVRTAHAQTPRMFAAPSQYTMELETSPAPPYPRYNFSIMVENLPKLMHVTCSLRWNTTALNITAIYPTTLEQLGFYFFGCGNWEPANGIIDYITYDDIGGYVNIVDPVEALEIEVECRALTSEAGTVVDISLQDVWDIDLNQLLSGDCPYDHTLYIKLSSAVGGAQVPIDKLNLLTPGIGLATTVLTAVAATTVCSRPFIRRKENE